VPPVPTRKILLGVLAAAVVLVPAGVVAAGAIDSGKETGARLERRRAAVRLAAEKRRILADQHPHSATVAAGPALVKELQRAITADARDRARRHLLAGPIRYTLCEHSEIGSEARLRDVLARYRCTAVIGVNRSVKGYPFATGYVFYGTVHFRTGRMTWCKLDPRPGEQATRGSLVVKLSAACAGPLRDIL
jgi:hypothetical protein